MKKSTLYLKAGTNVLLYIIVAILTIIFFPKLFVFFMPFVIGWVVSAIANPPVKFLEEKIKFKRKATSAIVIVLIIALIIAAGYGIVVFLVNQCIGFVESIPEKWESWSKSFETFGNNFNNTFKKLPAELREPLNEFGETIKNALANWVQNLGSGNGESSLMSGISSGLGSVAGILVGIIMCVLSAYFFTVEHNNLAEKMEKNLPEHAYSKFLAAYRGLKNAVGGYFKAQLQIELWVYLITVIGLLILGIDYAVIIALGIAILDFLPFFGAGLVMVPWAVIGFVNGNYFLAIGMLITWGVGQTVRQLIQPKIVGDKVGVAPLPTLILLFLGYKFWNLFGMVIAVPIAMIFISLYEEGVFDTFITSLKILWKGVSEFRKLPPEEKKEPEAKTKE